MCKSNNTVQLATLCYIRKDGKILLMHRNKRCDDIHYGKWNGLGGKFLPGESPEECVTREVKEESGVDIFNPSLCGVLTFPEFTPKKDWYVFVFVAKYFDGVLQENSEGSLQWVEDEDILHLSLWEGDKVFLPLVLEEKFFTGKFIYKDKILMNHSLNSF